MGPAKPLPHFLPQPRTASEGAVSGPAFLSIIHYASGDSAGKAKVVGGVLRGLAVGCFHAKERPGECHLTVGTGSCILSPDDWKKYNI